LASETHITDTSHDVPVADAHGAAHHDTHHILELEDPGAVIPFFGETKLFGIDFHVTNTILTTWIFMIGLFAVALLLFRGIKNRE